MMGLKGMYLENEICWQQEEGNDGGVHQGRME